MFQESYTLVCNRNTATPARCNIGLDNAVAILDCLQAGKTKGRLSGVGSIDDQKMYIDYLMLTAKCSTLYNNVGFLPLAQFASPVTGKINPALKFNYYYGIVYNKLDDTAIEKAVSLLAAYSSGDIKDPTALVFLQNAIMGFPCDRMTDGAVSRKTAEDWVKKNNPVLINVVTKHCR